MKLWRSSSHLKTLPVEHGNILLASFWVLLTGCGQTVTPVSAAGAIAQVTISASRTSVQPNDVVYLSARQDGTTLSGGTWFVEGGASNGTVDDKGTYYSPSSLPETASVSVAFTSGGGNATIALKLMNPLASVSSITPTGFNSLSTPILLTGQGFVNGSTILVNGTAVATSFIDSSHLTGLVVLDREVNATVQVSVANPDPGASTSASLQVPAVFAPIAVIGSQASVATSGTIVFSATRQGTSLSGGSWTLPGGSTNGSIDQNGLYHAPATVPASTQISVAFTRYGASASGSVSITNPVPVVRTVAPATISALSTPITVTGSGFVNGSTILVNGTAVATSFIDSSHLTGTVSLASKTNQAITVAVRSPDPGASSSGTINISTLFPQPSQASLVRTFNTPSYFMEQSDEFVGPFPSWTNVKTSFGAVGDGVTDDTVALQNAINSLTDSSASCVLYLPAGTYKISSTLLMAHMRTFSFIGEDPINTTIRWAGAQGGTMVQLDGSTYFRLSRFTLDGSNIADIAEDLTTLRTYADAYYSTFNELSDQHILGVKVGIRAKIDAETAVERVFFDHLSTAGLAVGDFNTLNIFVNDSLFLYCGAGLTDVYQNGSGSFVVSNSYFYHSQVADMSIANTGVFTARHNTSTGSQSFFLSLELYDNSSTVTLQNNTILDPVGTPFQFGNLGPFMLIDNTVRLSNSTTSVIQASWTPSSLKDVFSIGNRYTPNGGMGTGSLPFQGRVVSYDDVTVPVSSIPDVNIPSNVYVPPNFHRAIFEPSGRTGAAVQRAIYLASLSNLQRPVVHLSKGIYLADSTITFPDGSDIQLIGDDVAASAITWTGHYASPVISVPNSNVSIRSLHVDGAGEGSSDGILLRIADEPNTQVIVDQASLGYKNSFGVNLDGLEHAAVEMFSTYTTGSITGVRVTGGAFRAVNEGTLGTTNHYTGSLQSEGTSTSFDVSAGGKYMVQDNWHDYGATSPQNFKLSGSGTVTEQGGAVYMNSSTPFEIGNFTGNVTLMGFGTTGGFNLASTNGHANLLNLGLVGNSATYLPSSTQNVTVGNVLNSYQGAHIAQTVTPDVAWMREMLAQTRSEYPNPRPTLAPGASRIRLNRVMVDSALSAVHILPDSTKVGLYYVIHSGGANLGNTTGACVSTTFINTNDEWIIMAGGEGDFEIVSRGNGKALGYATSPSQSLTLEPLTGAYDQRWILSNLGDGSFQLLNRQSLGLLSLPAPGACAGIASGGSTKWAITAY